MKKYVFLCLVILLNSFLIAEEYEKDEWTNDENEIFNAIDVKEEKIDEENEELKAQKTKNNYFSKMYVEGVLGYSKLKNNNYYAKINSHILASYYEAFLSFSTTSEKTLALRFSPILMHYPKNHISYVLSLYLSSFNTPQTFKNLYKPLISSVSTTSNRKFYPPLNSLKISKNSRDEGIALEVSLPFFNFYSFWKNTKKGNIFNTYISYKNNFSNSSRLNIGFISSIQEIKEKIAYSQVYGLDFNFSHQFFYINSISLLNILPKRKPSASSFALKAEGGITSNIASLYTGISYKGAYYLGDQNLKKLLQKKSFLSFYLQGKIKHKIFKLNGLYYLLKDYKTNKMQHSYGFFYSLGNSQFSYKNELYYKASLYKIKFAINIKPNLNYFRLLNLSLFLYLQDKNINPKCLKQYEIASKCSFNIAKNFHLNFAFATMQENKNWKKLMFLASTSFNFTISQEKTKEKGEIKLKYNSKNNRFDITFKLKIEY
ncbi:MAG: hypothetical protein ACTTJ6_07085 [Treponema sp.]